MISCPWRMKEEEHPLMMQTWTGQQGLVSSKAFTVIFVLASGRCEAWGLPREHGVLLPPPQESAIPARACTFCRQIKTFSGVSFFCFLFLRNWWLTRLCHGVSLVPQEMDCWAESGWAGQRAMQMVFMFQTCHATGF